MGNSAVTLEEKSQLPHPKTVLIVYQEYNWEPLEGEPLAVGSGGRTLLRKWNELNVFSRMQRTRSIYSASYVTCGGGNFQSKQVGGKEAKHTQEYCGCTYANLGMSGLL